MATYGLAHDLIGFRSSTLRVAILEERGGDIIVRTADLLDAGTVLALDAFQVTPEPGPETVLRHRDGLVTFA